MTAPTPPSPRPSAAMQAISGTSQDFRLVVFVLCAGFAFHIPAELVHYHQPITWQDLAVSGVPFVFGTYIAFPDQVTALFGLLSKLPLPSFGRHE